MFKKFFITALISTCLLLKSMEDEQKEQNTEQSESIEMLAFRLWPNRFCKCIKSRDNVDDANYLIDLMLKTKLTHASQFIAENCQLEQIEKAKETQKELVDQYKGELALKELNSYTRNWRENNIDKIQKAKRRIRLLKKAMKKKEHNTENNIKKQIIQLSNNQTANHFCNCIANAEKSDQLLDLIFNMEISSSDLAEKCELKELETASSIQNGSENSKHYSLIAYSGWYHDEDLIGDRGEYDYSYEFEWKNAKKRSQLVNRAFNIKKETKKN